MSAQPAQIRMEELQSAQEFRALSAEEHAELAMLAAEVQDGETAAIEASTERLEGANAELEAELLRLTQQNHALEALVQEQEGYLKETQAFIAQMEERRRNWRDRYSQLTGKVLATADRTERPH